MLPGITPALFGGGDGPGNDAFTVLLLHFDGPNSSTVMPDSSPKQHGNAAVAGGCYLIAGGVIGGAALVNPANGYIAFPNSSDWEFGAGDFTVDWWEYRNVAAGCAVARDLATTYCPFLLHFGANGEIYMTSTGSSWDIANGAAGVPSPSFGPATLSVWNHFAVTRQGNTFRAFKNGVQKSTWTSSLAIIANANPLCIGAAQNGQNVNSYMDELRISKGIARWTANFTPPKAPYGPDYVGDSLTKLLMHFDAATGISDSSPSAHGAATTAGTGVGVTGTQKKFGDGSCLFPGGGACVYYLDNPDFNFGSGDFTIDCCARVNNLGVQYSLFGKNNAGLTNGYGLYVNTSGTVQAYWLPSDAALVGLQSAALLADTNWHHYVLQRAGGLMQIYFDGVLAAQGAITPTASITTNNNVFAMGQLGELNAIQLNGYIDELRVSKVARWSGNFSPPSAPYNPVTTKGPATHFSVTAPAAASVNSAFNITVQALDANNSPTDIYSGTVHFTSTDGAAVLPANSTLTAGVGTFSVTLKTAGSFTVTATDTVTGSITGSANVTANAMPTVVATATTNNAANTTHSVNLPAGNVGDMLIVFIGGGGITAANGGWTSLDTLSAVYRVATGADALSVTLSGSFTLTAVAYRIVGYAGVPESVSVSGASVTTIDPPALTPSWGLANNLWFASCIYSYPSAITLTATPANYGDAIFVPPAIGANNSAVYTSTRLLRATSDDPGVFNLSAATQPRGRTVAIRGA